MTLKKVGKFYHARIKDAAGKPRSITTKATSRADAKRAVRESGIAQIEAAARAGRLTQEAIARATTGKKITATAAVSDWLGWLEAVGKAPKTIHNNAMVIMKWLRDERLESTPTTGLTEKHINHWVNDQHSMIKAHTRRVNLAVIRTFFSFLTAKGWAVHDPSRLVRIRMDLLSHEQKEPSEKLPFTSAELKTLITYLQKTTDEKPNNQTILFWNFATRISNEVSLRLGDICQLEWSCFEKPGRVIVWTDKRDKRVSVPISDELAELVTQIPISSDKYLFPVQRDIATDARRRSTLSVQFIRILDRLEITGKSFHSLRHTCITRWHKEGKSLEIIGKDVGHSDAKTTKGYIH